MNAAIFAVNSFDQLAAKAGLMKQIDLFSIALAWIGLSTTGAIALYSQEDDIWGERILEQPFEKAEFRAIRIPQWVEATTGVGYTLSVQDP